MRHLFFSCFLMLLSVMGLAQNQEVDSVGMGKYRGFEASQIKELQTDSDYDYPVVQGKVGLSPWERFLRWLREFFTFEGSAAWWEAGLYIILFAALVLAIIRLLGVQFTPTFGKDPSNRSPFGFSVGEEQLDKLNFEEEIEKAQLQGNWRLAVRLRYLQGLHLLAQKGHVDIQLGKTNVDYLYEIREPQAKSHFAKLARLFDFIWYGEFEAQAKHGQQSAAYVELLKDQNRSKG